MPSDKVEVEPCFVVAALIIRAQAQDIAEKRESTLKPYLPLSILPGIDLGPHSGVGPGGIVRAQSAKASSKDANIVDVVTSPCSTIEIISNQVLIFFKHHCTNC